MYTNRLNQLTHAIHTNQVTNQLISEPASIYYFTGYKTEPGERFLLLNIQADGTGQLYVNQLFPRVKLDTDLRDKIQVIKYSDGEPVLETLNTHILPGTTGIDKYLDSHFLLDLMSLNPDLSPDNNTYLVDDIRGIKSPQEQTIMREASAYNDQAMEKIIALVQFGLPESEMIRNLASIYQDLDQDGFSFEPIIAYGPNGADPHHETNDHIPDYGDTVVIDIGAKYKDYASDMTRTVFYGQPPQDALDIYDLVLQANQAAIDAVKPGVRFADIDLAARRVIEEAGFGKFFTHRTGHFIGQECHEAGDVSQYNENIVQPGQVFSIEPGIYLPGKLGVRIEDLVIVTEDGCEVINHVSKQPLIVDPFVENN